MARPLRGAGAAGVAKARARAARARRAEADGRDRSRLARGSARRAERAPPHDRRASAGAPLRRGLRRQPASGARPRVPRRVRAGPGRADVSAEAARGPDAPGQGDARAARRRTAHPGRSREDRAAAPAAGDRRGHRSFVALVSAHRRRRRARRACPRSTCSTSCARSPGTSPTTRRCSAGRSSKAARSSIGRRPRVRATPSTTSSTISPRCGT